MAFRASHVLLSGITIINLFYQFMNEKIIMMIPPLCPHVQWIYPSVYRENKYADMHGEINFGLLDINLRTEDNTSDPANVSLTFRVIDHKGLEVIRKQLEIPIRRQRFPHVRSASEMIAESLTTAGSNSEFECAPIRGQVSWVRVLLYRAAVALPLLVLVVCPSLTVLWFLLAACWYISYGQELRRRERIEQRRQQLIDGQTD